MDWEIISSIVQNVGFPIAITVYLLVRMESKMDQLSGCIAELSRTLESKN
ncbi:YvrJ family protein [Peptostreptococcus faecalis]|nr:YvrJ family protein [Peptostreptococcus faecalis]